MPDDVPSTWWKRSKMRSSSSAGMPGPVSSTSKATQPSSEPTERTVTRPPRGVNLSAFETRFDAMISTFSGSNVPSGRASRFSADSSMPRRSASGTAAATSSARSVPTFPGSGSRRRRPDSSRALSSSASTWRSSRWAFVIIDWSSRCRSGVPASAASPSSVSSGPRSSVSGVRSSCVTLAKKRLLARSSSLSSSFAVSRRSRSDRSRRRVRRLDRLASQVKTADPSRKNSGPTIARDGPPAARLSPRSVAMIRPERSAAGPSSQGRNVPITNSTIMLPAK